MGRPCNTDREGKLRKVVGCSCVVIKGDGKESQAKGVIKNYLKCKKWINKTLRKRKKDPFGSQRQVAKG